MDKYAISTWIMKDTPFPRAVSLLAESEFDMIEISGSTSDMVCSWKKDCVAVVSQLASHGLSVSSIHCSTLAGVSELDSPDADARRASIEVNLSYFAKMRDSGVEEIVLHTGKPSDRPVSCRPYAKDSLKELADEAGKLGIRIAVENITKTSGPEASIAFLLELIEGMGEHVGLCLDIGHSAIAGLDPLDEVREALKCDKLFSLHLHDVTSHDEDHVMPGEGRLDIKPLIDELELHDFSGLRTIELKPSSGDIAARLDQAASICNNWNALS